MTEETTVIESVQPVETPVEAVQPAVVAEASVETTPAVEVSGEAQVAPEVQPEASIEPVVIPDLQFEGHSITVTLPTEAIEMASAKGFDAQELAKELYGSEDFTLSTETREKLDAAYGKFFVDSIIGGLKADQSRLVAEYKAGQQAIADGEKAAFEAVSDLVGGEEGWGKLEAFAATLPAEVIESFNQAMEYGNPYIQRLAVKDLVSQMSPESQEDEPLVLVDGTTNKVVEAPTACSALEYRQAITSGEYAKDPAKWDAMRRNGQSQGL